MTQCSNPSDLIPHLPLIVRVSSSLAATSAVVKRLKTISLPKPTFKLPRSKVLPKPISKPPRSKVPAFFNLHLCPLTSSTTIVKRLNCLLLLSWTK